MLHEIFKAAVIAGGLSAAFVCFLIGYSILRQDRSTYERNRQAKRVRF